MKQHQQRRSKEERKGGRCEGRQDVQKGNSQSKSHYTVYSLPYRYPYPLFPCTMQHALYSTCEAVSHFTLSARGRG